ncbi:MAG: hypothetical protein HRU26_14525, partial [Psychroserpens sp.]|nr:hypothetical protein [Psychroserpens sp.]
MKNFKYTLFAFFISLTISAQVGINTTSPDASSILDISAMDKGLLIPRVTLTDVTNTSLDGLTTAATGLLIYNTNASITGGDGVGYYYFNGALWEKVITSNSTISDNDFHEVGTTTAPDDISDDIFTQGAVAIGANTTNESKLNVSANPTENYNKGISVNMETGLSSGLFQRGLEITMNTNPNLTSYNSTALRIDNTANAQVKAGIESRVTSTGGGSGKWNLILSTSGDPSTTGNVTGIINTVTTGGGSGTQFGIRQRLIDNTASTTGNLLGFTSDVLNQGTGPSIGFQSQIQTNNGALAIAFDANHTGNSGAGSKYGLRSIIPPTVGGNFHYGVYSQVLRTSSGNNYAGYFLGNVSIGTTNGNNYIFPASRGAADQIMQTDGAGNLSWVDASSVGDNDADFYEIGTTNAPDDIGDNIYTLGNLAIGKNGASAKLDILTTGSTGILTQIDYSGTSASWGIWNRHDSATNNFESTGQLNQMTGVSDGTQRGIQNFLDGSGDGIHFGVSNTFRGAGSGLRYGVFNSLQGAGTGNQFGVFNSISSNGSNDNTGELNRLQGSGDGNQIGVRNDMSNNGDGDHRGVYNFFNGTGDGVRYGVYSNISGTGDGDQYGAYNRITNNGNGAHYGTFNELLSPFASTYTGSRNRIESTGGGTQIGNYNSIVGNGSGSHIGVWSEINNNGLGAKTGVLSEISGSGNGIHIGNRIELNGTGTGKKSGLQLDITVNS